MVHTAASAWVATLSPVDSEVAPSVAAVETSLLWVLPVEAEAVLLALLDQAPGPVAALGGRHRKCVLYRN